MDDKTIIENYNNFVKLKKSENKPYKVSKYINSKYITKEEKDYLNNRWQDSSSLSESLYRIVNDIPERHKCPVCGKFTEFVNKNDQVWRMYCSWECKVKNTNMVERHKQGCLKKYGVENISQVPGNREKFMNTMENKYGHKNNFGRPEVLKTIQEKYGVETNISQNKEIQEKIKETNLKRYGYSSFLAIPHEREKWKESNKEKEFITKQKNGTNWVSPIELEIYKKLKEIYPNTISQYFDINRYPFRCDIYIPELDVFIEYQGYFTHNYKKFDINNKEHIIELNKIKELADKNTKKYGHSKYNYMIYVWTKADPFKRETAKKNNLNYIEMWPDWTFEKLLNEIEKFKKFKK